LSTSREIALGKKRRITVEAAAMSRAPPAAVFALLRNSDTWPQWSLFDKFALERAGQDEPFGVGAIRVFATRFTQTREQVTALVPDQKLSYVLLSGLPMHDYLADVVLSPREDGGTRIRWSASFACAFGTGWFWRLFMQRTFATVSAQLAAAAEREA
jgi:uncharacterized protein YndB with AHSA1/START domain